MYAAWLRTQQLPGVDKQLSRLLQLFCPRKGMDNQAGQDHGSERVEVNSNELTTPKLPPPPRSAQNKSGFSVVLARTSLPSSLTTSAEMRRRLGPGI
jgi:hypothetical protein